MEDQNSETPSRSHRRYHNVFYHKVCSICEKGPKAVAGSKEGKPLCFSCNKKHNSLHEICFRCEQLKPVWTRDKDGKPICNKCNYLDPNKFEECSKCQKLRPVTSRDSEGKPLCLSCHRRNQKRICKKCKEEKKIQALVYCSECCKAEEIKVAICHICNDRKYIRAKGLCNACYESNGRKRRKQNPRT